MNCTIVDYGTGNIQSVQNALESLGHSVNRSNNLENSTCDCLIFPGQGAFGPAIKRLHQLNLIEPLVKYITSNRPFIGICLGFQLLFEGSKEAPNHSGLGAFKGTFEHFKLENLSVPHMGWNQLESSESNSILSNFNNQNFYFVHSYYLPFSNQKNAATTSYGHQFVSAIATETKLITQFHPEKSGDIGLELLDSFLTSVK
ncbi:MAG: imidazole glycerol phosphate synthase subunit HisH [Candidatus Marinamargulisbacteria bacterium]